MTELDYLDRQQNLALDRVRHALLGSGDADSTLDAIEQATARRPWMAVGVSAGVGAIVGGVAGLTSARTWIRATRLVRGPLQEFLRGQLRR